MFSIFAQTLSCQKVHFITHFFTIFFIYFFPMQAEKQDGRLCVNAAVGRL